MKTFLQIAGIDFTGYVQKSAYSVMTNPKYASWTDANQREHRDLISEKVSGKIKLSFASRNNERYKLFAAAVEQATRGSETRLSVYSLNADKLVTDWMFLTMTDITQKDLPSGWSVTHVTMKVEQA